MSTKLKEKGKKLAFYAFLFLLCFSMLITAVFAWIIDTTTQQKKLLIVKSGDADMEITGYVGVDKNKDGVLDDGTYEKIASNESTPADKDNKNKVTKHEGFAPGSSIHLRFTVKNTSTETPLLLSTSFQGLNNYFIDLVTGYTDAKDKTDYLESMEAFKIIDSHSSMMLYALRNIKLRVYNEIKVTEGTDYICSFDYTTLKRSSIKKEETEKVTLIENCFTSEQVSTLYGDLYLLSSSISWGDNFIENVFLDKGEILQIDFELYYIDWETVQSNYEINRATQTERIQAVLADNTITVDMIEEIARAEIRRLLPDDNKEMTTQTPLKFTIDAVCFTGKQTTRPDYAPPEPPVTP